jgi:hypothetical protein
MANAAKDPLWQAKVSSEVVRSPNLQRVIEEKCSVCHMPMATTQATTDGIPAGILNDGFLNPAHALNKAAMDGVSCTLCHQIQDADLGEALTFSGNYPIDTSTVPPERLIFGPFPEPDEEPMRGGVGFTPVQGLQTTDSGLCATCHTLYTPHVDAQGNLAGEFPEQTTYLEWEHSDYGDGAGEDRACRRCHMPEAVGPVVISTVPKGLTGRSPFGQHHFVGGSVSILKILRDNIDSLGLTASGAQFEATLVRTVNQLENDTASLSIVDAWLSNQTLTAVLSIENKTGHKFPTGFPSRRVWVHLTVTDPSGRVVFESGRPQADGSVAGGDADESALAYEPHYETISRPDQVQIYEAIMRATDGHVTYTLLRSSGYIKDNRLLPVGFNKETANDDIAVWGMAASDDNFVGGSDQFTYQIDVEGHSRPFTITAELVYQSISYPFVQDLRQDNTSLVESFGDYWDNTDKMPTVVARVQQTIR